MLASLDSVPEGNRSSPEFRKAVALLRHIVAARRVWLGRLGVAASVPGSMFTDKPIVDPGRVAADWQQVSESWAGYLSTLDDTAISQELEYQSLDAGRFRSRIEDILAQLFGHSSYHRGQIAMLVRASGGQPAVTDLILWTRQPVAGSGEGQEVR